MTSDDRVTVYLETDAIRAIGLGIASALRRAENAMASCLPEAGSNVLPFYQDHRLRVTQADIAMTASFLRRWRAYMAEGGSGSAPLVVRSVEGGQEWTMSALDSFDLPALAISAIGAAEAVAVGGGPHAAVGRRLLHAAKRMLIGLEYVDDQGARVDLGDHLSPP